MSATTVVSWWSLRPDRDRADQSSLADYLLAFHLTLVPFKHEQDPDVVRDDGVALIDARAATDTDLPDAIAAARAQGLAVIVLLAWGSPSERADVLDLGADDCLAAPIERRELAARIQCVRRGHAGRPQGGLNSPWVRFGSWLLDTERRCVSNAQHETASLSPSEFRLLLAFLASPYQVISRERLMDEARGRDTEAFDRSIDLLVSRLRGKLGDDPRQPRLIQTIRGQGYLFNAVPSTPIGVLAAQACRTH
jgi:two-component system OmpR family response regulator